MAGPVRPRPPCPLWSIHAPLFAGPGPGDPGPWFRPRRGPDPRFQDPESVLQALRDPDKALCQAALAAIPGLPGYPQSAQDLLPALLWMAHGDDADLAAAAKAQARSLGWPKAYNLEGVHRLAVREDNVFRMMALDMLVRLAWRDPEAMTLLLEVSRTHAPRQRRHDPRLCLVPARGGVSHAAEDGRMERPHGPLPPAHAQTPCTTAEPDASHGRGPAALPRGRPGGGRPRPGAAGQHHPAPKRGRAGKGAAHAGARVRHGAGDWGR